MAIHEILYINAELQDGIVKQRPANELKDIAIKHGMKTLRQGGLRKVAAGMTTLDEIIRVTFAD
jgi:type II secretory ATPase GspE/PulE/Tfp pilus assembly ATPase PilB-like protein